MTGVYDGNEWEVRLCSTDGTTNLAKMTKIPFVKNWSEDRDPGIKQVPLGMGYGRGKKVHETLTEITGSLEKGYCDTLLQVQSPGSALSPFGEIASLEDIGWWLQFKNRISGKTITFSGVHGHYTHDHAEDDFGTETWDWAAEAVIRT
jgi:hypothetical protein